LAQYLCTGKTTPIRGETSQPWCVTQVPPAPEGFETGFLVMYTDQGGLEPGEEGWFVVRFEPPNGEKVSILVQ
jgi:hypothetical protein